MEKRKIIRKLEIEINRIHYESLKPSVFGENGDWERKGRKYDIKGIDTLLRGENFDFVIEPEVQRDLDEYRNEMRLKRESFLYQK